ncbi:hypothetical protein R6Q59_019257 [Mikania micrantha]
MGTCASIPTNRGQLLITNGSHTTVKVIHSIDGRMHEFRPPIKASNVLSDQQPDTYFLCSAEEMFVNCQVPRVSADEHLQPGNLYFIMPISRSYRPISLQELCLLAIKASLAIEKSLEMKKTRRTTSFKGRRKSNGVAKKVDFQLALKKL